MAVSAVGIFGNRFGPSLKMVQTQEKNNRTFFETQTYYEIIPRGWPG